MRKDLLLTMTIMSLTTIALLAYTAFNIGFFLLFE